MHQINYGSITWSLMWAVGSLFLLSGCFSHIYNPALNLPAKPLQKGEVNLSGNFAYLPETRPEAVSRILSPAVSGAIRVGVTDDIALQTEGWADVSETHFFDQGGLAFSLIYLLPHEEQSRWIWGLSPKYGFILESSATSTGGHGFALAVFTYLNTERKLKPYFALSPMYGFQSWENSLGDGAALALQTGLNYEWNSWLNFNIELPLVYQYNREEELTHLIPSVQLGMSVDLNAADQ